MTAEAKDRLAAAKRRCDEIGVPSTTLMVKSFSPAEAIIEQSKKHDCDVVFMASHGRQGFAAVLLGYETQKVLTHSQITVMVYRSSDDAFGTALRTVPSTSVQFRRDAGGLPPASH